MKHINQLRQIAPYIQLHRHSTFVVLIPGDVQQQAHYPAIIKDILLLQSIGVRLLLVFGCRPQIDDAINDLGIESTIIQGKRVTSEQHMKAIIPVVAQMQLRQMKLFSASPRIAQLSHSNVNLVWGNWVIGQPLGVIEGIDFGLTGKIRSVDSNAIQQALDIHQVVALHPLLSSRLGAIMNVSSEEIAGVLAKQLAVEKLVIFAQMKKLKSCITPGQHISSQQLAEILPTIESDNEKALLQLAAQASDQRVSRIHLVDSEQEGSLLQELFTREGSGLMVANDNYEVIEQANSLYVSEIHELIQPMEEQGLLRLRDTQLLEQDIDHFYVLKYEESVIGCAAIYPITATIAELACFVIAPQYQGKKKGSGLLEFMEKRAVKLGFQKILVLTTQTKDWFEEHGFASSEKVDYSELLQLDKIHACRNARILTKRLDKK